MELDAKKKSLGFGLRGCQLYFVAVLIGLLSYALIIPPAAFAYDFSFINAFVTTTLSTICIWMLQQRMRAARTVAIASLVFIIVVSTVDMFLLGAFNVVTDRLGAPLAAGLLIAQYSLAAACIVYLAVSPNINSILTVPLDIAPIAKSGHSYDIPLKKRIRTWVFWRDLIIYFIIFSFAGHWAEMSFCYGIHLGIFMGDVDFSEVMLWHQWLFPYFAEGVAIVLIVVVLTPIKEWLLRKFGWKGPGNPYTAKILIPAILVSFIVTAAICTTIDFTCGMICNQNYEVWDYRALPFNFMGQICLQNSTVYSIAASILLWIVYPLMDTALRRIPKFASDGLFFALLGIYAFSALLHFMYMDSTGLVVGDFEMKPENS